MEHEEEKAELIRLFLTMKKRRRQWYFIYDYDVP